MSDGEYNSDGYSTYPNDSALGSPLASGPRALPNKSAELICCVPADAYMAAHKHVYDTCKSIVPSVPLGWCPK